MKTNVCHKHFYSSSSKNWVSALKHSVICFSHVFGNTYGDLYHYAGNNPVRYMDPDGKFSAIYRVNMNFNADWNSNIEKYKKNAEINKQAMQLGIKTQQLPSPFLKTINENSEKYLLQVNDWANYYACSLLGFEDYSVEQAEYRNEEIELFQCLQNLRTSKNPDGSYKTDIAKKLLMKQHLYIITSILMG